jgi:hypothetical protein
MCVVRERNSGVDMVNVGNVLVELQEQRSYMNGLIPCSEVIARAERG